MDLLVVRLVNLVAMADVVKGQYMGVNLNQTIVHDKDLFATVVII